MDTGEARPAQHDAPVELCIPSERLIRWIAAVCVGCELLFVVLDYHVNYGRATEIGALRRLTNIAREDSLASWFGTTQTLFVALTLWLIYFVVRERTVDRWRRIGWLTLAALFSWMTIDDGAQLHERAGTTVSRVVGDADSADATGLARLFDAFPSYSWMLVALPVLFVVGAFGLVFLWRELPRARPRLLIGLAVTCFALAIVLDFFEGLDSDHPWNLYTRLERSLNWGDWTAYRFRQSAYDTLDHFSKSIEEFLEMLANTLLWLVFLRHLAESGRDLRVRFR